MVKNNTKSNQHFISRQIIVEIILIIIIIIFIASKELIYMRLFTTTKARNQKPL